MTQGKHRVQLEEWNNVPEATRTEDRGLEQIFS